MVEKKIFTHLHITLKPGLKIAFQEKLISDGILVMQGFFIYFIDRYIEGKISEKEIQEIKKYQVENPGKIEKEYVNVLLDMERRKKLALKKIRDGIGPQYLCRFYIEEYLNDRILAETIQEIKDIPDRRSRQN